MSSIVDFIKETPVVLLSGGFGSELHRRGYKTSLPLWSAGANLESPLLVKQIHKDYIAAGSDIIITNTFRTQPYTYRKAGKSIDDAHASTTAAVRLAKEASYDAKKQIFIGGGLTTLEDCYEPENVPPDEILIREHSEQSKLFEKLGVDFIFCETVGTIKEAKILAEISSKCDLPFLFSFIPGPGGKLLSGESLEEGIKVVNQFNPLAILLNCKPVDIINEGLSVLRKYYDGPKGAYGNGIGKPNNEVGWEFNEDNNIEQYVDAAKKWISDGIKIIGGCCGTNPEYIKRIKRLLTN